MGRLSKQEMGDRGRFNFKQEEVELEEIGGSVLVRSPSVAQRDELAKHTPDDESKWELQHTALLFATVVVDPEFTVEEAQEFLGDWPASALDTVIKKFVELTGQNKEEMRKAAGEFRSSDTD